MARGLKFRIHEEHELYYLCSENSRSASLFSHMQTAGFLMTGLKYYGMRWLDCLICELTFAFHSHELDFVLFSIPDVEQT